MAKEKSEFKARPRTQKPPVLPRRPDQRAEPLLSVAHERLLGRAIMGWAQLEAVMQGLVWAFLNLSMRDGRTVTSRMDAGGVLQLLRELAELNLIESQRERFRGALNLIEDCRTDRNMLGHATWLYMRPENQPFAMSLKPKTDTGDVVSESFSRERMYEIINNIETSRLYLLLIENVIKTSRDKLILSHPPDE